MSSGIANRIIRFAFVAGSFVLPSAEAIEIFECPGLLLSDQIREERVVEFYGKMLEIYRDQWGDAEKFTALLEEMLRDGSFFRLPTVRAELTAAARVIESIERSEFGRDEKALGKIREYVFELHTRSRESIQVAETKVEETAQPRTIGQKKLNRDMMISKIAPDGKTILELRVKNYGREILASHWKVDGNTQGPVHSIPWGYVSFNGVDPNSRFVLVQGDKMPYQAEVVDLDQGTTVELANVSIEQPLGFLLDWGRMEAFGNAGPEVGLGKWDLRTGKFEKIIPLKLVEKATEERWMAVDPERKFGIISSDTRIAKHKVTTQYSIWDFSAKKVIGEFSGSGLKWGDVDWKTQRFVLVNEPSGDPHPGIIKVIRWSSSPGKQAGLEEVTFTRPEKWTPGNSQDRGLGAHQIFVDWESNRGMVLWQVSGWGTSIKAIEVLDLSTGEVVFRKDVPAETALAWVPRPDLGRLLLEVAHTYRGGSPEVHLIDLRSGEDLAKISGARIVSVSAGFEFAVLKFEDGGDQFLLDLKRLEKEWSRQ